MTNSIPIKLLHEATGFEVTIQLISGDKYRGILSMVEDNMNCYLNEAEHIFPNGNTEPSETAYIRGSNILFVNVPEIFENSRLFSTDIVDPRLGKHSGKLKRNYMKAKRPQPTE